MTADLSQMPAGSEKLALIRESYRTTPPGEHRDALRHLWFVQRGQLDVASNPDRAAVLADLEGSSA